MKPRQTSRSFHHNPNATPSLPPFQPPLLPQQLSAPPLQIPQLPPPPAPAIHPTLPPALRGVDLAKLGLNFDDNSNVPHQQANPSMHDDILKYFQAIYGKNGAEILQNQSTFKDLAMQSLSPPDHFPKIIGGASAPGNSNVSGGGVVSSSCVSAGISSGGGAACSRDSIINSGLSSVVSNGIVSSNGAGSNSASMIGSSGGASGAANFNNNISKNNNSAGSGSNVGTGQQNKQDIPFLNAQQHQAVATSSAINNFRVPTSTNAYYSPLQQSHSSSLQSQQQKSVLSLHQQHQNDRRLNNQHQNSSSNNTSFSNLNLTNMSGTSSSSSSSMSTTPFDAVNSNNSKNNNLSLYPSNIAGLTPRSSQTMMDALKVHSSLENLIESGLLSSHGKDNNGSNISGNQQALTGHQHLQRLLKASAVGNGPNTNHIKSQSQLAAMASTLSSNLPSRNDLRGLNQRSNAHMTGNNMSQSVQNQRQLPSAISPTQVPSAPTTSHSLPKSLLNLAACSTSPHDSGSKLQALNQLASNSSRLVNSQSRNLNNNKPGIQIVNAKGNIRGNSNSSYNNNPPGHGRNVSPNTKDPTELLQQIMNTNVRSAATSQTRTRQPTPLSLLSDQTASMRNNLKQQQQVPISNAHQASTPRSSHSITTFNKQSILGQEEPMNLFDSSLEPKDHYLANLQERAARAGVSIDEINDKSLVQLNNPAQSTANQHTSISISAPSIPVTNDPLDTSGHNAEFDSREIESALSRVEARNDLSLLYPPMLLGPNSQKQLNALSAGFQMNEESELFTSEVKRIVLEECNVIYECKQCSNLFRSLANLVRHKRAYCIECNELQQHSSVELHKGPDRIIHEIPTSKSQTDTEAIQLASKNQAITDHNNYDIHDSDPSETDKFNSGSQSMNSKYNLRAKRQTDALPNNFRSLSKQGPIKSDYKTRNFNSLRNLTEQSNSPTLTPTSLSKLLQSQPRNRQPVARDNSALMNALRNKPPGHSASDTHRGAYVVGGGDPSDVDMIGDINEQLVSKSSLAQTLLNENAKSSSLSNDPQQRQDVMLSQQSRHFASKRKLEDCISKVKRGKLSLNEKLGNASSGQKPSGEESSSTVSLSKTNQPGSSALLRALTKPAEVFKAGQNNIDDNEKSKDKQLAADKVKKGSSILAKHQSTGQESASPSLVEDSPLDVSPIRSPLVNEYTCDICKSDFKDRSSLYNHTLCDHKTTKTIYPCIFCSLSFIMLENVCRHIMDMHKKGKMQVDRLKEVVRSRSYVSEDFTGCNDFPSTPPTEIQRDPSSQKSDNEDKSSIDIMTPRLVITDDTSQSEQETCNNSLSLNGEDHASTNTSPKISTHATSSSPQASASQDVSSVSHELPLSQQSTSILTESTSDQRTTSNDLVDDEEADLILSDISDEYLLRLRQREEEIDRLKEAQQSDQDLESEPIEQVGVDENHDSPKIIVEEPIIPVAAVKIETVGISNDPNGESAATCPAHGTGSGMVGRAQSSADSGDDYVVHEEEGVSSVENENDVDQNCAFKLDDGGDDATHYDCGGSQDSSPFRGGAKTEATSFRGSDYMETFSMPEESSIDCQDDVVEEDSFGTEDMDRSGCNQHDKYDPTVTVDNQDEDDQDDENDADADEDDEGEGADDAEDEADSIEEDDVDEEEEEDDDEDDDDEEEGDYDGNEREKEDESLAGSNNAATNAPSGSGSTSGASGGSMKLKIQLKTQPDEKTKVYRIV